MADKKTKVELPGVEGLVDAIEVAVEQSTERWSDITLADGTTIRMKPVVLSAVRILDRYDQDGNPIYQLKANQVMTAESPAELKRGAPTPSRH